MNIMLVRLTKCTVKGHSAPKMEKKIVKMINMVPICAPRVHKTWFFLPLFDNFSKWIKLGTLEKSSNLAKIWFRK